MMLGAMNSGQYDQLITSFPAQVELDYQFFDFMKEILYKKFGEFLHLEHTGDGVPYIRISDLSKIPANVVLNMCICSRIIVEKREFLSVWSDLCAAGIHPSLALAMCKANIPTKNDDTDTLDLDIPIKNVGSDSEHWPFYLAVDLDQLVIKGPKEDNFSSPYKSHPYSCTPTNRIWGEAHHLKQFQGLTVREFWTKWQDKLNENLLQPS